MLVNRLELRGAHHQDQGRKWDKLRWRLGSVETWGLYVIMRNQGPWDSWAFCPISWGWSLKVDEIVFIDKELADLNNAWLIGICKPLPVNRRLKLWLAPLGRGP